MTARNYQINTNIKFSYSYRDAGGYRNRGRVVFSNLTGYTDLKQLETAIRQKLFNGTSFYTCWLALPSLHFNHWNGRLDNDWYHFDGIALTDEKTTDSRSIDEFLADLEDLAQKPPKLAS